MNSSDDSSISSEEGEDPDPIIGIRQSTNKTSPDYRAAFALCAKDLSALRTLCDHVEDDDEFEIIITVLFIGLFDLKKKAGREDENQIQRAFFTSYGKMQGMKTQALYMPNGMIGSTYWCSICHNDKGVVNLSGIESALKNALEPYRIGMAYPKMFGDEIFEPSEVMCRANGNTSDFYKQLLYTRGDIAHVFGLTSNLWKRCRVKHTWQLLRMKNFVFPQLFSIFFMTNCYTCLRGNNVNKIWICSLSARRLS